MKKYIPLAVLAAFVTFASTTTVDTSAKIGIIDFKNCFEESKYGKQEMARFQELGRRFTEAIEAKEKEANDLAAKCSEEYLDTLTPEAEQEIKTKCAKANYESNQMKHQANEVMPQSHYQMMQAVQELVAKAAEKVTEAKGLDMALNQEVCFYNKKSFDISKEVVAEMDKLFEAMEKEEKKK